MEHTAASVREGMNKMAKEITEEFISGFCKMQNQTRTVICEMEIQEDGSRKLYSSDCAYGACEHSGDCLLMGQIFAKEP